MTNRARVYHVLVVLAALTLALAACSEPEAVTVATPLPPTPTATATVVPPTATPTVTPIPPTATATATEMPTPIPPTPTREPLPGFVPEGIEVTMSRNGCSISGPTEIPPWRDIIFA